MAQGGGNGGELTGGGRGKGMQPPAQRSVAWPGPQHSFDQFPERTIVYDEATNGEMLQWERGNWKPLPKIYGDEEVVPHGCVPECYKRGIIFNPTTTELMQEDKMGPKPMVRALSLIIFRRAGLFLIYRSRGDFVLIAPPFPNALAIAAEVFSFRKAALMIFPAVLVPVPEQVEALAANLQLVRDSAMPPAEKLPFLRPQPAYELVASLPRQQQDELLRIATPPPPTSSS